MNIYCAAGFVRGEVPRASPRILFSATGNRAGEGAGAVRVAKP